MVSRVAVLLNGDAGPEAQQTARTAEVTAAFAAVGVHAPRPPSRDRACLEDDDALARGSQRDRRGHAGVARADDRYAVTQVFQAIQNLRKGVSEVRCVSTRNPSRSISARSWR